VIRLCNLVKNECIKVIKKRSNLIIFLVMLIALVGITIVRDCFSLEDYNEDEYTESMSSKETYKKSIAYLKNKKDDESKRELTMYKFLLENELYNRNDWKVKAIEQISESEDDEYNKEWSILCKIVKKGDYNDYLAHRADIYKEKDYTCDILKDAIINPFKYLHDNKIQYNDKKTQDIISLVNFQDKLENASRKNDSTSRSRIKQYTKQYLILKYKIDTGKNVISELDYQDGNTYDEEEGQDKDIVFFDDRTNLSFEKRDFWFDFFKSSEYLGLFGIVMLIIASNCVASEFSRGTIKFLIINPKKRGKILISKYLNLLFMSFVGTILLYIFNFLLNLFINLCRGRVKDIGVEYLYVTDDKLCKISPFLQVLIEYGYGIIGIIMVMTLAFAISSLAKNSNLATGIGVTIFLGGSTIKAIFGELNIYWGRYFFFSNIDILNIKNGQVNFYGMTVTGALINLFVHWAIFMLIAYDGFVRREV